MSSATSSDEEFHANEGGSLTVPVRAGVLRKGDHVVAKD